MRIEGEKMTVRGKKIWNMVLILLAVFVGLVFLFPVFWMIRSSFMGLEELYANPPLLLPKNATLQNYQAALAQTDLWLQLRNSWCNNAAVCDGDGDFLQSDSIRIFKI